MYDVCLLLQYCLSVPGLQKYRDYLKKHLPPVTTNKLRDVPDEYVSAGHAFRVGKGSRELIFSFDVCGGCEGHAILHAMEYDSSFTVQSAPLHHSIDRKIVSKSPSFRYCPSQ
jgi:hypothetical protein